MPDGIATLSWSRKGHLLDSEEERNCAGKFKSYGTGAVLIIGSIHVSRYDPDDLFSSNLGFSRHLHEPT